MGVKGTFEIPREVAIKVIAERLEIISNGQLANMLEHLPESEFRNYSVVDKIDESEIHPMPRIHYESQF